MERRVHVTSHMDGRIDDLQRKHLAIGDLFFGRHPLALIKAFLPRRAVLHDDPVKMLHPLRVADALDGGGVGFQRGCRRWEDLGR